MVPAKTTLCGQAGISGPAETRTFKLGFMRAVSDFGSGFSGSLCRFYRVGLADAATAASTDAIKAMGARSAISSSRGLSLTPLRTT